MARANEDHAESESLKARQDIDEEAQVAEQTVPDVPTTYAEVEAPNRSQHYKPSMMSMNMQGYTESAAILQRHAAKFSAAAVAQTRNATHQVRQTGCWALMKSYDGPGRGKLGKQMCITGWLLILAGALVGTLVALSASVPPVTGGTTPNITVTVPLTSHSIGGMVVASCPSIPSYCDVSIVGGGPGGVYAAYRLVTDSVAKANYSSVCIFESQQRVGGRIFTLRGLGPDHDQVLDMGAYRYQPTNQPLVTSIIETLLQLNWTYYLPTSTVYRRIATVPGGPSAGFVTFVEALAQRAVTAGVKLCYGAKVTAVNITSDSTATARYRVSLSSGQTVSSRVVIMNLPPRPLQRVLGVSNISAAVPSCNAALRTPFPAYGAKLYAYYDDAWWLTKFNLTATQFYDPFNSSDFMVLPLRGRYYDVTPTCKTVPTTVVTNLTTTNYTYNATTNSSTSYTTYSNVTTIVNSTTCSGFLLAMYMFDAGEPTSNDSSLSFASTPWSAIPPRYFKSFAANASADSPYVVLDNTTCEGRDLLQLTHSRLVDFHASLGLVLPATNAATLPRLVALSVWDEAVSWVGAGLHWMRNGLVGAEPMNVPNSALRAFPGYDVFVANEAYSTAQGWAEGSLVMMENVLHRHMGLKQPSWISNTATYTCLMYDTFCEPVSDVQ